MVFGSGKPALGFKHNGLLVHLLNSLITGSNSFGPREQLIPIASTSSPETVSPKADILHPVKVLRFCSKVIVASIGKSEFSFAARIAAFISSKSVIVSNTTKSAPALAPAFTHLAYISYAASKDKTPVGSNNIPIGPKSRATKPFLFTLSLAFLAISIPAVINSSTEWPHSSSLYSLAPNVLA